MDILSIVQKARSDFENRTIDRALIGNLYLKYNPIPDIENFVETGLNSFPNLCCGLASVYLKHLLGGEIVKGKYNGHNHTFLLYGNNIVDITADQYGGPKIYYGELKEPWEIN